MNPIASNTRGTSSSSRNNAARPPHQQAGETKYSITEEAYELCHHSSWQGSRATETGSVTSAQNESSTSSHSEDSNRISLQQELLKALFNIIDIENRVNSPSLLKQKILSQNELDLIQNRLHEARSKLSILNRANQEKGFTRDLKGKGKLSFEKELERLEELEQQIKDLKDVNGDILKFLATIEADLKGKALYDFSYLRWVTGTIPPLSIIPSTILNIVRRNAIYSWCIAMGTSLITWGINDVFIPLRNMPKQHQTEDLKAIKEEVFSAIFLCALEQRINDLVQRSEEMSNISILKTQQALIQTQQELAKRESDLENTFTKHTKELNERDARHEGEINDLKVQMKEMEKNLLDAIERNQTAAKRA